jgi:hypothetical protein
MSPLIAHGENSFTTERDWSRVCGRSKRRSHCNDQALENVWYFARRR